MPVNLQYLSNIQRYLLEEVRAYNGCWRLPSAKAAFICQGLA